ncbi:NAD-dependent epimerase/dehydratase family protein [Conexibacter sp. SYSU D00693]|uniref:NAD-dependent epimerase/dehydratase family protein n=1 Tax=Conexibacter sp. SYSU D00693 TaxID=2812560 RepID=UPI00196AD4F6|nr:NAD-dependent epimerase/dehydratase family protein [Conexibacter sp. SYSU D00693]
MGKTLVTGGAGLVGSHVVRALLERGDDVRVTVRERTRTENLEGLDVERVTCDLLDARRVRRAMRDVDRLFHVAGSTRLRAPARDLFRDNVDVTRVVLGEALRAGVERVVHTSSMAAVGPAPRGSTADETQVFRAGRHGLPYVNAQHEAEAEALRHCAAGLPVVIVNPGHVLGRGDVNRSSTEVVRRFLRRELPAYVDGALCVVSPQDVARGHLLAEERGTVGERYILGGRNFTLDRLFADLGRLSGVEPPAVKLPLPAAIALARGLEAVPGRPAITEVEVKVAAQWWAFRSTKAKRELGWSTGHHEEPLTQAIAWYRERDRDGLAAPGARQPLALRAAGLGLRTAGAAFRRVVPG